MENNTKSWRTIGILFYTIGIAMGMIIGGGIVWGDLEASLFDSSISAKSRLNISCPVLITTHEVGQISATLKNPADRDKSFFVRAHISEGYVSLKREIDQKVPVAPGQKAKIYWEIYPEDAAYNRIILFRAYVNASYPVPSQGNFCGVLVVDFPWLSGTSLLLIGLAVSLLGSFGGITLWRRSNRPLTRSSRSLNNAMTALAVFVFGTIIVGYIGIWILGVILFAVSILMIGIILGRYGMSS